MIYETPEISDDVKKYLDSDNYRDRPILSNYSEFQDYFVCLHPFLRIKEGHYDQIKFETGNWPNKLEIETHCEPISWTEIMQMTGIQDLKSLDRALAFYHRAYRFAERTEYLKLRHLVEKEKLNIIPPQVDELPEILENKLLQKLSSIGYSSVYVYTDINEKDGLYKIEDLTLDSNGLPGHVRIETPDSRILIVQDFDQRFIYLFGDKTILKDIIAFLGLEGFFCVHQTPESWSFYEIPDREKMDWDEDMKEK